MAVVLAVAAVSGCSSDDVPTDAATSSTSTDATSTTTAVTSSSAELPAELVVERFAVPAGARPHDVAPAADGTVWYTAQATGRLGRLDPANGDVTEEVTSYPLPASHPSANLNTAVFTGDGTLWFTGQAGLYGRLVRGADAVDVFDAPGGAGPYGITSTPEGDVYYASLAGNHLARIDTTTGEATVLEPPTPEQGTRRVWTDSTGRIWSSQWHAGQVAVYDPMTSAWQEWSLPGDSPQAYAVFVDEHDRVWLADWGANALVVFEPRSETFRSVALPDDGADVRQILGRAGEVWAPESGADALVVVRTS